MDDLSQKIDSLLQSPQGMQKIQAAMAAFGSSAPETGAPDTPAGSGSAPLGELLHQFSPPPEKSDAGGSPDMARLIQLMSLLSGLNKDDENTALLRALRPYLHGEREKRVDDAIHMMRLMKLMPLLTEPKKEGSP